MVPSEDTRNVGKILVKETEREKPFRTDDMIILNGYDIAPEVCSGTGTEDGFADYGI
jgi:hypothetical protein